MSVKKYLTLNGLTYFLNKIKTYLTSSTYLNSIGISNSDIDDIADDAGYSSGSLPASEDIFITGDIIPNTDNSVDLGASSKNFKMIYTKGITINGTQFLPSDYIPLSGTNVLSGSIVPSTDNTYDLGSSTKQFNFVYVSNVCNHSTISELSLSNVSDGADIVLCPKEYNAGFFRIRAFDGTTRQSLNGYANGTLSWSGKNIDCVEEQGDGYIRYSNGLQICFGVAVNNNNLGTGVTRQSFPVAFSATPIIATTPSVRAESNTYTVTIGDVYGTTFIINSWANYNIPPVLSDAPLATHYVAIGKWK